MDPDLVDTETRVLGLTGQVVTPMGKGEGVLVTETDGLVELAPLR